MKKDFWLKAILLSGMLLYFLLLVTSCTPYNGSISQFDANDKLVMRYTFESNQPMSMKAGDLQSDSRIKPLVESLMLELGYKKETGGNYSDNDNFDWGEN